MSLGKTKDFPRGKLNDNDEGGLRISVGVKDKTLIVDFGTEVTWIGMDKEGAIGFANAILEKTATM